MTTPIIYMEAIHKDYHVDNLRVPALRGIDMTVERGEFTSIIGPFRLRQIHFDEHIGMS